MVLDSWRYSWSGSRIFEGFRGVAFFIMEIKFNGSVQTMNGVGLDYRFTNTAKQ